jgi:hypothetical protein
VYLADSYERGSQVRITEGDCSERRDLRKSIVGLLNRIDYPLLSGPYSRPVSLLMICRSREQAECGVTLPQFFLKSEDETEGHTKR